MLRVESPAASVAPPEELAEPTDTGDYALLDHDVLGGWLFRLFLEKHDYAGSAADELAALWAADHLWLYRDGAESDGWLWQIALTGDAEALGGIETELPEGVTLEYQGGRAFIAGGTDGAPPVLLDAGRAFLSGS
jgi:hypothetical protein